MPFYSFRIKDSQNLILAQRGTRKPAQIFNNRSLEKLFQKFESVKFFLTKEQLREVIVRRKTHSARAMGSSPSPLSIPSSQLMQPHA